MKIGGRYEHIGSGEDHILLGRARMEHDGQHVVIYRKWFGEDLEHWITPVVEFQKHFAYKVLETEYSEHMLKQRS